jgi:hypothetical protein
LNHFLGDYLNIDIKVLSIFGCKFGHYLQFSSLQISAWFVVLISVDRAMSVVLTHWKTVYFKDHMAFYASFALVGIILTFNSYILISFGIEVPSNRTDPNSSLEVSCYEEEGYPETERITRYAPVSQIFQNYLIYQFYF